MIYHKYRIWCVTDSKWEYLILEDGAAEPTTCPENTNHEIDLVKTSIIETIDTEVQAVTLNEVKTVDGVPAISMRKSYLEKSTSMTSPNYCNRQSWYGDVTKVVNEVLTTTDNLVYTTTRTITHAGWNHDWINWKLIPNNARISDPTLKVVVKKNGVTVAPAIYSVDNKDGKVTFTEANLETDVITVSYAYANSSKCDIQAKVGKVLLVDYIEVQISEGIKIPDNAYLVFQSIYNGPAVPAFGIPANTDTVVGSFEYHGAADFAGEATQGYILEPFMGLTKKLVVMPWSYLTGYTMKSPSDVTTNLARNEFNKLRMRLVDANGGPDPVMTDGELGSATIYSRVEPAFDFA